MRFNKTSTQIKDELYRFIHERNELSVLRTGRQRGMKCQPWPTGRAPAVSNVARKPTTSASWPWPSRTVLAVACCNKFLGDTLSTVEYMANEKREMINKWGFWGLIFFVWIPFMASGVLVGAMLGLLSLMLFMSVLLATLVGVSIASVTLA